MGTESTAILMTPPGAAAIAVIRLRGPLVGAFLKRHLLKPPRPGRCVHADLIEDGRTIDDAVIVMVDENTADLNVHGGQWIVRRVLDLAHRNGFKVIESTPLPLPPEAVDAENELEREVLAALSLARTEIGVRALLTQQDAWDELRRRATAGNCVRDELARIMADQTLARLLEPARVVIVGAPNVGKSTLANQLFAHERSITADLPGTTRDWVGEIANIDGLPVMLVDTPGLRQTGDAVEQAAIERSGGEIAAADLLVLVLDVSRPLEEGDRSLLDRWPQALRVINKCDRARAWDVSKYAKKPIILTAATTGDGIPELRRAIIRHVCGNDLIEIDRPFCWTARQRCLIERALEEPLALQEI